MNTARLVEGMERHQIPLYLLAIVAGGLFGWLIPAAAGPLELSITPVLGSLLFATFLGIPFAKIGQAVRDGRLMATVMILNFLVVPVIVFGLSRINRRRISASAARCLARIVAYCSSAPARCTACSGGVSLRR